MYRPQRICLALALASIISAAPLQAQTYTPGQDVQVREGDIWSPAKLLKQEGRRYQIQYNDGTDEWVGTDRLRLPGAETAPADGASGSASPPAAAAAQPPSVTGWFKVGDNIEAKRGAFWQPARVLQKRGNWTLVIYDDQGREWVEPYRLRQLTSDKDVDGWFQNDIMKGNVHHGPPTTEPALTAAERKYQDELAKEKAELQAEPAYRWEHDPAFRDISHAASAPPLSDLAVSGPWTMKPDPAPEKKSVLHPMHIPLEFAMKVHFYTPRAAARPTVLASVEQPFKDNWIEKLDLVTGTGNGQMVLEKKLKFQDVSPSGELVVYAGRDEGDKADRVDVWNISGRSPQRAAIIVPGQNTSDWGANEVKQALFVDDQHLLVVCNNRHAVLWQLSPFQAVWTATTTGNALLTPGGKYLVVPTEHAIRFIEPLTGTVAGELTGAPPAASLAISPTGRQLVAHVDTGYFVWDLASGKLISEFDAPLPKGARTDFWSVPVDGYALVDNYLVDLSHHLTAWKYTNLQQAVIGPGRHLLCYMTSADRKIGALEPGALPGENVEAALKTADFKDRMLLQPGTAVALQIQIGSSADQKAIRENWTKQLAAHAITVDDHAPIRIIASISTASGSGDYSYMMGFHKEHVTFQKKTSWVRVEWEGKTAWEKAVAFTGDPGMISVKQGQTAQQAVDEHQRQADQQVAQPFETVRLPVQLPKPSDQPYFGESVPSAN